MAARQARQRHSDQARGASSLEKTLVSVTIMAQGWLLNLMSPQFAELRVPSDPGSNITISRGHDRTRNNVEDPSPLNTSPFLPKRMLRNGRSGFIFFAFDEIAGLREFQLLSFSQSRNPGPPNFFESLIISGKKGFYA